LLIDDKYKQLTDKQRYIIAHELKKKTKQKGIAQLIGVHPSTISREIKRNFKKRVYNPEYAQVVCDERRREAKKHRKFNNIYQTKTAKYLIASRCFAR